MLCNHWLETLDRALVRGGPLGVSEGFGRGGALSVVGDALGVVGNYASGRTSHLVQFSM